MTTNTVTPTGEFREVGVDDLFFSTTDAKGVIEESNSTFVSLSRYGADELRGSAHNIIRHPFMPRGIFHLMWERLAEGKTFAGYVRNLAKDGVTYDVFATVTPVPGSDHLLSVRQRPCHDDHRGFAMTVYDKLSAKEAQWAKEGLNKRDVAQRGRDEALAMLAGAGFASFDAYQSEMMYWEVYCREGMSKGLPQRPDATGTWANRLTAATDLHDGLDEWVAGMGELAQLADRANISQEKLVETLGAAAAIKEQIDAMEANSEALHVLSFQLNVWAGMSNILDTYIAELTELLGTVVRDAMDARSDICATRLHSTMLATFVAQAIDAENDVDVEALKSKLEPLELAAAESVESLDRTGFARQQTVNRAVAKLRSVVNLMGTPRSLLAEAAGNAQEVASDDLKSAVNSTLEQADRAIADMQELADALEGVTVAPDSSAALAALSAFKRG